MSIRKRYPIGVSDFSKIIEGQYQFADKTLFIKEVIDSGAEVMVITRPRRFGKTLNLSMLYYFLKIKEKNIDDSSIRNIFDGLEISKEREFCKTHQNKYPVIFFSFKDIKKQTFKDAYEDIVELIRNLYEQYEYLMPHLSEGQQKIFKLIITKEASKSDISVSIKQLSFYLYNYHNQKPIILIDEYDTPIQAAYLNDYYNQMVEIMRGILGATLKDNQYLYKSVITGITRVSQESLFSGLNNVETYSVLREEYGQYFGFLEDEVKTLISESNVPIALENVREWYNGYKIGQYTVYNPWSILNCLSNKGNLRPYWLNTASHELLFKLIGEADDSVKTNFELLLQGETIEKPISESLVFPELETKEEALWSLLLYAGYLNVLSIQLKQRKFMGMVSIPNKEVGFIYDQIVEDWFRRGTTLTAYGAFIDSLENGDLGKFKKILSEYILDTGSYFDFNIYTPEKVFHGFVMGLVVGFKEHYSIRSNKEAGLGRCDVIFMPKDKKRKGIILEFKTTDNLEKLDQKAKEALLQIKDKQYIEIFKAESIKTVLAIGLSFCGKQVDLASEEILL